MNTNILLIRHGQTDWNNSKRWQGHTDTQLNTRGQEEAKLLAARLTSWPIQAIYSSDLSRAYETAKILGEALLLKPIPDASLRERNGGVFEGLTSEEMLSRYENIWHKVRSEGAAPPGGESNIQVARRIIEAYEGYRDKHRGQMIALISHGGALRNLISFVLGLPLGQQAAIAILENTAVSIIRINKYGQQLATFNDSTHLNNIELGSRTQTTRKAVE